MGRSRVYVTTQELSEELEPIRTDISNISQAVEKVTTNELPHIQAKCDEMDVKIDAIVGLQSEVSANMGWVKPLLIGIVSLSTVCVLGIVITIVVYLLQM